MEQVLNLGDDEPPSRLHMARALLQPKARRESALPTLAAAGLFALHDQRITLAQPSEDIRYYALRMKRARFSDANVEAAVSALALAGIPVYAGPADAEPVMQVAGAQSDAGGCGRGRSSRRGAG